MYIASFYKQNENIIFVIVMERFMNYVFMVLIASFFTAIIFYAAETFFPVQENKCWTKYNLELIPKDNNYNNPEYLEEQNKIQKELEECNKLYETTRKSIEGYKLIFIVGINAVILLALILLELNNIGFVSIGLQIGILLSSIISSIAYYESASKIALIIIVILFIEAIIVLSKIANTQKIENTKKTNENEKKKKK